MTRPPLYPLRFEPIFKTNIWGGQRLRKFLNRPSSSIANELIGEAWVLSDVDGSPDRVANGPQAGISLRELLAADAPRILGPAQLVNGRFPVLLKFIDSRRELSVQVHPNDEQAARKIAGSNGKTEAWVVLEANPATSRIYAGLQPDITAEGIRESIKNKTVPVTLHGFTPLPGDCVFLEAGTVHAIGSDILLFEIQQTSDITYRLFDWDRIDAQTGRSRELHVEEALEVVDFARGPCHAVEAKVEIHPYGKRERLVTCDYFTMDRVTSDQRVTVGTPGQCRIVVVLATAGRSTLDWDTNEDELTVGDVILIPAEIGDCAIHPAGTITWLECYLGSTAIAPVSLM